MTWTQLGFLWNNLDLTWNITTWTRLGLVFILPDYLYDLKINNITSKTDFNGLTIISLLSEKGNFLCRTRWDMSPTLPYVPGIGPYDPICEL